MARTDWTDGQVLTAAALNTLGAEINALSARVGVLEGSSTPTPEAVTITTTGATFSPLVALASGSTATVHWDWAGGTTTGLTPTISFGSTGTRTVSMTVLDATADAIGEVVTFNLGYDATQDSSSYSLSSAYNRAAQSVSGITNVNAMTGLVRFMASNTALSSAVDFSGMSALTNIECFDANITSVTLTGCTALVRLCVETNALTALDLNPVAASLYDLRAADMVGATLALTPLTANLAHLFHFCVRDQPVTNHPGASRFPALEELWNWNTNQSGTLAPASTAIRDLHSFGNGYSSVSLTGCPNLSYVDLRQPGIPLSQSVVDGILTTLAGFSVSGGLLDLTQNSAPSSTGLAARTTLIGRGWTVNVNATTAPATPTGLSLAPANTQLTLSWTAPSNGGSAITSYTVRYRVNGGGSYTTVTGISAGATSYAITGLANGTTYNVSVLAINAIGAGSYASDVNGTPTTGVTTLFSDDFHRANGAVGNGWSDVNGGFGATIASNQLSRSSAGSYQLLANPSAGTLPANYSVEISFPHSRITDSYFFVFARGAGGTGVRVGWEGSSLNTGFSGLCIGLSDTFNTGDVTVTADSAFPASWAVNTDHTLKIAMSGTLVNVYCDGVLVGHGTITANSAATGTSFGVCGGSSGLVNSVTVTTP